MAKQEIKGKNVPATTKLFSRGISIANPKKIIFLSARGCYEGKGIREQTMAIYSDITELLKEAGATWDHVARVLLIIKDSDHRERDYEEFDKARIYFFKEAGVKRPYPAATGIFARLPSEELLIEMEVTAVID
jgi:enamine deaminase RidA (YjgF/YER057c/UK114 family)